MPHAWPMLAFDPGQTGSRLTGDRWAPSTAPSKTLFVSLMEPHVGAEAPGKWEAGFKQRPEGGCFLLFHGAGRGRTRRERAVFGA